MPELLEHLVHRVQPDRQAAGVLQALLVHLVRQVVQELRERPETVEHQEHGDRPDRPDRRDSLGPAVSLESSRLLLPTTSQLAACS